MDIKKQELLDTIKTLKSEGKFNSSNGAMDALIAAQGLNKSDFIETPRSFPLRRSMSPKNAKPRKLPSLTPPNMRPTRKTPSGSHVYEEKLFLKEQKKVRKTYAAYSILK